MVEAKARPPLTSTSQCSLAFGLSDGISALTGATGGIAWAEAVELDCSIFLYFYVRIRSPEISGYGTQDELAPAGAG